MPFDNTKDWKKLAEGFMTFMGFVGSIATIPTLIKIWHSHAQHAAGQSLVPLRLLFFLPIL